MDNFDREGQSVFELKPYLRAIGHTPQSVEQIANLALQLEISAGGNSRGDLSAEMRYLHNSHLVIENRLPASNDHILDSAELVSLHRRRAESQRAPYAARFRLAAGARSEDHETARCLRLIRAVDYFESLLNTTA